VQALQKEREALIKRVPRKVPITWVGAATEVKLVGTFDAWTRGVELSGPDSDGNADSVLRTFEATVSLLPVRAGVQGICYQYMLKCRVAGVQGICYQYMLKCRVATWSSAQH
jgi:hypothetical protein